MYTELASELIYVVRRLVDSPSKSYIQSRKLTNNLSHKDSHNKNIYMIIHVCAHNYLYTWFNFSLCSLDKYIIYTKSHWIADGLSLSFTYINTTEWQHFLFRLRDHVVLTNHALALGAAFHDISLRAPEMLPSEAQWVVICWSIVNIYTWYNYAH